MFKSISSFAAPILLALCAQAHADVIGVHLVSYHSTDTYTTYRTERYTECQQLGNARTCESGTRRHYSEHKYNNVNPGMYWRDDSGLTAGFFKNSYGRMSVYGGWTFESSQWHDLSASVTLAAVTGYKGRGGSGSLRPMVMPGVSWQFSKSTAVRVLGGPTKDGGSLIHLTLERKL